MLYSETSGPWHEREEARRRREEREHFKQVCAERDRFRELLVQVLEFTERHVSVNSPWTREVREVREALGLPATAFDPTYNASAPASAPTEPSP